MKINSKFLSVCFLALGIVIGANNFAMSDITKVKIAVVDVPSIVAKSQQVQTLKNEETKKAKELSQWLETVNAEVKKQSTDSAKQALAKKYNAEFEKKKEAHAKEYREKLEAIDSNISATIAAQAKANGYSIVLAKSTVLYGGEDITPIISKAVK